ncbi:hypothetical protein [Kitasatospora sp. NPDC002965]|uniref:hypothetical protein n=1 Tax=Kitasatospora sp. NPDC002965 TaxID=3154775 RepID=UPI0033A6F1B5
MKIVESAVRAACSALLLAAPLVAAPLVVARPAAAEGPHNAQEAAVCRQVLGTLLGGALGLGGQSGGAVCAVQPEKEAPAEGAPARMSSAAVTYDLPAMRQQVAELRQKAVALDLLGEHAAAREARAQADALQRRIDRIVEVEERV